MSLKKICMLLCVLFSATASAEDRPNILWLSTEDISPLIGAYGYDDIRTPNIDALAAEGVLYNNAYVSAPVCAIMRSAIVTGMFSSSQGTQHMRNEAIRSPGVKTYPELLIEAGYYATKPGKTDYQGIATPAVWNTETKSYIDRPDKSKPFMHIRNYTGTHESRSSNDPGTYDIKKLSSFPPYYPDTEKARRVWASHLQTITNMDGWIGEQLGELEASGEADNTIVIFWGDHGSGLPRGKRWIYDSGLKIPVIVRVPDKWKHLISQEAGSKTDQMISTIDFAPTMLNLAGADIPDTMHGTPFLGKGIPLERKYINAHRDRMDERYELIRAVKDKRFKYIRNYEYWKPYQQYNEFPEVNKWSGIMEEIRRVNSEPNAPDYIKWFFQTKPLEELYDTQKDPHEMVDLAQDPAYADKLNELRAEHVRWRKATRDLGVIPEQIILDRRGSEGEYNFGVNNVALIERAWDLLDNIANYSASELMTFMKDEEPVIRYWATIGLGNLADTSSNVKSALKDTLDDQHVIVRSAAARGLLMTGPSQEALDTFVEILSLDNGYNNLAIINEVDLLGDKAKYVVSKAESFTIPAKPAKVGGYVTRALKRMKNKE